MDQSLQKARREIASEIGADAGSFTAPERKRFTGIEIMVGIGGAMLYSFFKGMFSKIGEKAGEKVGEKAWDEGAEFLEKEFSSQNAKGPSEQEQALEAVHRELKVQIDAVGLTPEQVAEVARQVEPAMVQALSTTAPEEVSRRIARRVQMVAVSTL